MKVCSLKVFNLVNKAGMATLFSGFETIDIA